MTFVRSAPAPTRRVDVLSGADRTALDRLIAADPITNAVVAARLAASRSVDPAALGGVLLGARDGTGSLTGAAFNGGNLIPVGGAGAEWAALAEHVAGVRRVCTSIVGPHDAVSALWAGLEPQWGPARAVRERQPLLTITRTDPRPVRPDGRLRMMHPEDLERYLPAAAAMFAEELGISPFAGPGGATYRRRIEALLANGRALGIVDDAGEMVFKADIGALTGDTCQLQGVWVRPDLRGRGIGTGALAGVLEHALRLAPSASLYVNDYNHAARRVYGTLGMREISVLKTVLF